MKTKTLPIDPIAADEPESLAYRIGTKILSAFACAVVACAWVIVGVYEFSRAAFNTLILGKDAAQQLREMEDDHD